MKHLLTILFILTAYTANSQVGLKGKWYGLSGDMINVAEYDFQPSAIVTTALDWKLQNAREMARVDILKVVKQKGNIYLISRNMRDSATFKVMFFSEPRPDGTMLQYSVSDEHTVFPTVADAMTFISADAFERVGLTFYSQEQLRRLQTLPHASTITRAHYKQYLQEQLTAIQRLKAFFASHTEGRELMFVMFFAANQSRAILANLNYNPLLSDGDLRKIEQSFDSDKELKVLSNEVQQAAQSIIDVRGHR